MSELTEREIVVTRPVMPESSVYPLPINKLTRIPYDPKTLLGLMHPGNHTAIIGATGAGKTTAELWLLDYLITDPSRYRKKAGFKPDINIVNEMGNWDTLMLSQFYEIRLFIPEGLDVEITPEEGIVKENIKRVDFNPYKIRADVLEKLSKHKINIIAYQPWFDKPKDLCKFWGGDEAKGTNGFFLDLLDWQRQGYNEDNPVAIWIDEINTFVPRYRAGLYSGQATLSNWLAHNAGKFRQQFIRIVGTSWTIRELNRNMVERFSYWIIKRVNQPEALDSGFHKMYNSVKDMLPHQCCIVNPMKKWHPGLEIDPIIIPRPYRFRLHFETVKKGPNKRDQLLAQILKRMMETENGGLGLKKLEISKWSGIPNSTLSDICKEIGLGKVSDQESAQLAEKVSKAMNANKDPGAERDESGNNG